MVITFSKPEHPLYRLFIGRPCTARSDFHFAISTLLPFQDRQTKDEINVPIALGFFFGTSFKTKLGICLFWWTFSELLHMWVGLSRHGGFVLCVCRIFLVVSCVVSSSMTMVTG